MNDLMTEIIEFLLEQAKKVGDNAAHAKATALLTQFQQFIAEMPGPAKAPGALHGVSAVVPPVQQPHPASVAVPGAGIGNPAMPPR